MLRRSSKLRERLFDDPFLFSIGVFELVNIRIQRRYLLKYTAGIKSSSYSTDLGCIIHLVIFFRGVDGFEVIVIKKLSSN
jgi:hypothetical protein